MFIRQMSGGMRQQVQGRNLTMHEHRQSRVVVPRSLRTERDSQRREGMEGRALVKGNEFSEHERAQYRVSCPVSWKRVGDGYRGCS